MIFQETPQPLGFTRRRPVAIAQLKDDGGSASRDIRCAGPVNFAHGPAVDAARRPALLRCAFRSTTVCPIVKIALHLTPALNDGGDGRARESQPLQDHDQQATAAAISVVRSRGESDASMGAKLAPVDNYISRARLRPERVKLDTNLKNLATKDR